MHQRLFRFDIRLYKDDYVDTFWSAEHRNRYLLRPEVEWPLSIDPLVWPSVFFSKPASDFDRYATIEVDMKVDNGNYWLNLEQMRTHYQMHRQPGTWGVFVAVHLFSEQPLDEDVRYYTLPGDILCGVELKDTVPGELPPGSEFLGYDIADPGRISGLANCSYTPEEKQQLAPLWQPSMNSSGLLKDLEKAIGFKELCDKRVPEHAPFWIWGISRLPFGGS